MTIRPLEGDETSFLKEMLYLALFVRAGQPPFPRSILEDPKLQKYIMHWGSDPLDLAFVAENEGRLTGAVWGRCLKSTDPGWGYVSDDIPEISMAVLPDHRGKGIGTSLLKAIAVAYKELGVKKISLSVDQENQAKDLYLRKGYAIVSTEETAYTMVKSLN